MRLIYPEPPELEAFPAHSVLGARIEQACDVFGTKALLTAVGHNVEIQSNLQGVATR